VRELRLRVAGGEVEGVLDALLPALPGGLHLLSDGGQVELRILDSTATPSESELRDLVGSRLAALSVHDVSEDWQERRLERYRPLVVAERLLVRPDWAPPGTDDELTEIVLAESNAFGTGMHPTTQACLAVLAESDPGGSLADYGCGSGVLSIAAALFDWTPVIAVDADPGSVAATRKNAVANGVEVDARVLDLTATAPPAAETIVANLPPVVQASAAGRLEGPPSLLIASGFHLDDVETVASAWARLGLEIADEARASDWAVLMMR
jgi:ribosomal protein L11 methyltransferase